MICVRSRNLLVCYPRHPSPSPFRARGDRQPSLNLTTKRVLQDPSPSAGDSSPRYCYDSSLLASVLQAASLREPTPFAGRTRLVHTLRVHGEADRGACQVLSMLPLRCQ